MSETTAAPPGDAPVPVQSPTPAEAPTQTSTQGLSPASNVLGNAPAAADPAAPAVDPAAPAEAPKPAEPAAVEYKDIKVPEGIAADNPALAAFAAEAGKLGIPQDKAEALLASVAPQIAQQLTDPYRAWTRTQEEWTAAIKADPEIGGDNFAKMQTTIARALDNPRLSDPGLREAMILTGAGNNPAVVRSLYRWAQALTEGAHVSGSPAAQTSKSVLADMYPSMKKEVV